MHVKQALHYFSLSFNIPLTPWDCFPPSFYIPWTPWDCFLPSFYIPLTPWDCFPPSFYIPLTPWDCFPPSLYIALKIWQFIWLYHTAVTTWNSLCQHRLSLKSARPCMGWASKTLFIDAWSILALSRSVLGRTLQTIEPETQHSTALKRNYSTCKQEMKNMLKINEEVNALQWVSGGIAPCGGGEQIYEGIIHQMRNKNWSPTLLKMSVLVERRHPGFRGAHSFTFPSQTKHVKLIPIRSSTFLPNPKICIVLFFSRNSSPIFYFP